MQKYFFFNNYLKKKLIPSFINVHKAYVYTVYNKDASANVPLCAYTCVMCALLVLNILWLLYFVEEKRKKTCRNKVTAGASYSLNYILSSLPERLSLFLSFNITGLYTFRITGCPFFLLIYNTDLSYFVPIMTFIRL